MTAIIASAILSVSAISNNTWFSEWKKPYGIPPFSSLKISQYTQAVKIASDLKQERIRKIVENKEAPTFENTIVPYIFADEELARIKRIFGILLSLERNAELEKASVETVPILSADTAMTISNKRLYKKIESVWNADQSKLSEEEKTILKRTYDSFRRSGVGLSDAEREIMRAIDEKTKILSLKISKNILASNNAFKKEFGVDVSDYYDAIAKTGDRTKREAMFKAYTSRCFNRGEGGNTDNIVEMTKLRIQRAKLLGYATPADFYNELRMAGSSKVALDFIKPIAKSAAEAAKRELAEIEELFKADIAGGKLPKTAKFEPWDVFYYGEKLKQRKFSISNDEVKKFFKSENVLKGVLRAAERLYGIKAKEIDSSGLYNPAATKAWEITDGDGSYVGVFIADYFPRPSKSGGAWMTLFNKQQIAPDGRDIRPVVLNACNFGEYLSPNQVTTAFHEFGHALHGLLSKCVYPTVSCTGGYSEYNEIFSQINELWAFDPSLLAEYAFSSSGETPSARLIEKLQAAEDHCIGIKTAKLSISALIDLEWNMLDDVAGVDPQEFERKICEGIGFPAELAPRHRLAHFMHIFPGGYTAAYYTYLWAEVIDLHLYSIFEGKGDVWDKETALKFRKTFLERGGSENPMKLFKSFTGEDKPNLERFFKSRRLTKER